MLKHIVCHKIRSDEEARRCADMLNALNGRVPSLLKLCAGVDALRSPRSYNLGITAEFEDLDGLAKYDVHPLHAQIKEYIASVKDASFPSVACDFYIEQ